MNKVILMGRLAKDPETKYSNGAEPTAITRFTLAVNRRFKREGEPDADFIPCVAFGKTAEIAEKYCKKGRMITLSGRIQVRSWDDQNGTKHWVTEVVCDELEFAESKKTEAAPGTAPPALGGLPYEDVSTGLSDEDLPF